MNSSVKTPDWSQITAVFGGAFDPPHLGHKTAALGLLQTPGVKKVLILPTGNPALKNSKISAHHRAEMAKLCFDHPNLTIDLREIKKAETNPAEPSYSFNTLQELKKEQGPLAFVIGADQIQDLHRWYRFPELLNQCHWIVLTRKPHGLEAALPTLKTFEASQLIKNLGHSPQGHPLWSTKSNTTLIIVPTEAREISSTQLRELMARDESQAKPHLSPEVLAYLKKNHLYGT